MTTFTEADDLRGAQFRNVDLRGAPQYPETARSCLHTILEEEWEHHRYAVRDLDVISARRADR